MDMRVLGLAIVFVGAVSYCQTADVEELVRMANQAGAPFTQTSLQRILNGGRWGAERADRSSDVVIINASGRSFELKKFNCRIGSYSTGLFPENQLAQHTSTVYGIQSTKGQTIVECRTIYESQDGHYWIALRIENTLYGETDIHVSQSRGIYLDAEYDDSYNNQVRFKVTDAVAMPSQQDGIVVPQRKPKGSRNKFIKASKSGSSVRTI